MFSPKRENADKCKDTGILLAFFVLLRLPKGVIRMAESRPELLNSVYREISEKLGSDTAYEVYKMFKGQQISFPMRFFNPKLIRRSIAEEYDGTNVRLLAVKYEYSEKTIRRILSENIKKTE